MSQLKSQCAFESKFEKTSMMGPDAFHYHAMVGAGTFGKVFRVTHELCCESLAMKVLSRRQIEEEKLTKYLLAERDIMADVSHPYIMGLRCAFQTEDHFVLVMQHCGGGTLRDLIRLQSELSETLASHFSAQILLALTHLHEREIIHRDLKPENVLLDHFGHAVIGDFGCSRVNAAADELAATFCGSNGYVAPEVLDGHGYTRAVDIYCLGVTLYEMVVGQLPFYHMKPAVLNRLIQKGELKIPSRIPEHVADFIRRSMCREVSQRLGTGDRGELFAHAFFRGMDFEAMSRKELHCPEALKVLPAEAYNGSSEELKRKAFGQKSIGARMSKCFRRPKELASFDYNTLYKHKSHTLSTVSTDIGKTLSVLTFQSSTFQSSTLTFEGRVPSQPQLQPCLEHGGKWCEL